MVRVSGWSGPSTRSWSASSCSKAVAAPAASPACPRQQARLLRVVRVSGWSGPSTRSWSASSSSKAVAAPAAIPGLSAPVGEVAAGGQGVGVVGAEHPQPVGEQLLEGGGGPGRDPPPPRASRRGCRGWSGCRGGRGRAPAAGRSAAARRRWPRPSHRRPAPRQRGEVVAGGQGVGVVGAEHPQLVGQQLLEQRWRAPAASPACPRQ